MANNTAGNGVEVLNALLREAALKHGNDIAAVITEVRANVEGLDASEREAALKALDMALQPSTQRH